MFIVKIDLAGWERLGADGRGCWRWGRNFIFAAMLETISEAHVFAEKTGLGSETMETLIWEDFGPLAHSISKRLTTGAYEPPRGRASLSVGWTWLTILNGKPGSDLNLAIKEVGHGITCAEKAGTRLKLAEVAFDHYKRAKKHADADGGRSLDSSSMYGIIRQDAGLDFETELVKQRDDWWHTPGNIRIALVFVYHVIRQIREYSKSTGRK